jgi:glycerol kinase
VILAIDQGTSATKALLVDGAHTLAAVEHRVAVDTDATGRVEVDPEVLWQSIVAAGSDALAAAGHPRLDAVALANQGETVVAWDRGSGVPDGPAVVWQDSRAQAVCDAHRDDEAWLRELTGLPLDPYFVAPKLAWLRPRRAASSVLTTSDVWLIRRLTGDAFVTDVATAGRTLLTSLDTMLWDTRACATFGVIDEHLPRIVANDEVVGETTVFGDVPVPVRGLCVDQQAALFAHGCRAPGDVKCTYGTGAFVLALTDGPRRSGSGAVACPAWSEAAGGRAWCLDAQVFAVGAAVEWMVRSGLIASPTDVDAVAGSVADTGGVVVVPALAGHGSPWWSSAARGVVAGLSISTERSHIVRAVLEGIAANVAVLVDAIAADLGSRPPVLRVDGGVSRSRVLLQLQADLAQCPVLVSRSPHATALGVAAFAGNDALVQHEEAIEPSISAERARQIVERWTAVAVANLP